MRNFPVMHETVTPIPCFGDVMGNTEQLRERMEKCAAERAINSGIYLGAS